MDYDVFGKENEIVTETSKTYAIKNIKDNFRIKSNVDEIEAVKQTIYLTLSIERYDYIMFSWDYGIELSELFGREKEYVIPELSRRITEALIQDDRINSVDNFNFKVEKNIYTVSFEVSTIYGSINITKEVSL